MSKLKKLLSSSFTALFALVLLFVGFSPVSASSGNSMCNPKKDWLFCDDFFGRTFYKDEHNWADWYRFHDGNRPASHYDSLEKTLRMRVSPDATSGVYSNAEVSLTELYKDNPFLIFGVDTRVDIRMRFSPNMNYDFFDPGTATGTAGFLFWNYYKGTKDPIHGQFDPVRDAFGFTWASETAPGLIVFKSVDSNVSVLPISFIMPGFDMSQYHTYSVERTHTNVKFYIDGVQIDQVNFNVVGEPVLPDAHKFTVDFWADNASYFFNPDGSIFSVFWDVQEDQWLQVDYVRVGNI